MAVVVLPLLPEGPIGPFGGIKPRELWALVLFFSGLSFTGYVAKRILGASRGYPITGLLGGMISSTNVTFTFARISRRDPAHSRELAAGVIGASTMLFPRVLIATTVLNPSVAFALLPYALAPFTVGIVGLLFVWRRGKGSVKAHDAQSHPLQIGPALQMAALFQIVLFAVNGTRHFFGTGGLLISGGVLGLTDLDALTISMSKSAGAGVAPAIAAQAIAIGILTNCVLKTGLALVLGAPQFKPLASGALAAMTVAIGASIGALR